MYTTRNRFFKLIMIAVLAVMIAFLWPFVLSFNVHTDVVTLWSDGSLGLLPSFRRSCLFAVVSSCVNTYFGLQLAISLRRIPLTSKTGTLLSALLLPVLLGNVTISYIFKCSLYGTPFFDFIISGGKWTQFITLIVIQFWQYGFLFIYLFWLSIRQIPESRFVYAMSVKMTDKEIIRDIIFPSVKILLILLFIINFVFAFYESAKCQFIFKMSQGMETELLSQALSRIHYSLSISNPVATQALTLKFGLLITCLVIFLVVACALSLYGIFGIRKSSKVFLKTSAKRGEFITYVCVLCTIIPIVVALVKSNYAFSWDSLLDIVIPLLMTIVSAFFASVLAIVFGIAYRIVLNKLSDILSVKSVVVLLSVFLLQLLPPICIVICGYKWMSVAGYHGVMPYVVWIWGHPIFTFPILASFIIATHYLVSSNEIDWLNVHRMTKRDVIKYSFVKRFKKDYVLTFLFAFTFIWNDVTLNKVLSDKIPSFADKMQRLFIGRAANDAQATLYALIALLIAALCVVLWKSVIKQISTVK